MSHLMDSDKSFVLMVDIQEKLFPTMANGQDLLENTIKLLKATKALDINLLTCEQYPKGLGNTLPELKEHLTNEVYEKTIFSACGNEDLLNTAKKLKKPQCIIAGIETHVCILQSVSDLINNGIEVFIPYETVSSRTEKNKYLALERMKSWGAQIVSLEQVFFEWLKDAKHEKFKEIVKLIK
jgi:nicotinamidase-related amidase